MLSEGSSVKGSPEDKQASAPYIRGSAKISRRITLARFTGYLHCTYTVARIKAGYLHCKPYCIKNKSRVSTLRTILYRELKQGVYFMHTILYRQLKQGVYFMHTILYRELKQGVYTAHYTVPIIKAGCLLYTQHSCVL